MNVFRELKVLPSYGKHSALITWEVDTEYRDGFFTVLRSKDETEWETIFTGNAETQYVDHDFVIRNRLANFFYQITVQKKTVTHKSDVVATFGPVSRECFGTANVILQDWGKKIQQGTAVKIFKQLAYNPPCPACTDADTGQKIGTTLCKVCFATGYEGGFGEAIDSWMLKASEPARATIDMEDGMGTRDAQICQVRMLAYPTLRRGDMIVDVGRDDRYLVGASTPFSVFGKLPILYDTQMELLRRNDIRYQVGWIK